MSQGDKIAIIGENGAGKSTFIKLILRIYEPTEGRITINGIDISSISLKDYLKLFSTVFQDYKLFSQTIEENITFDKGTNETEQVIDIIKKVGMYDKIYKLPKNINTNIYKTFDENGYIPSEGEAQRIAFARAIYKEAKIFIFDEPTSSLDPYAEMEIYKILNDIIQDRNCFFISHRLGITKYCNRILVFDNGRLVEDGTHNKLLEADGIYSNMYNLQADLYEKSN